MVKGIFGGRGVVGAGDFRLGNWLVQPRLTRISRGRREVHLRPKLMDLLVFLAQHGGQVVSKREILDGVWAKRFMAESVLSGLIAELRALLGDQAHEPRFIETVPKRGYRLVAPVELEDETGGNDTACVLIVAGRRIPLGEGEHIIGRAPDAAVHVDSTEVSRHHARVVLSGSRASIEDLGSKNGTFVGEDRVTAPRALKDGDQVRVGGLLMVFRLPRCIRSTMTVPDG